MFQSVSIYNTWWELRNKAVYKPPDLEQLQISETNSSNFLSKYVIS